MIQKNLKLTEETKQSFDDLFNELFAQDRVKTQSDYVDELVERYKNPKKIEVDRPEIIDKIATLETENAALKEKIIAQQHDNSNLQQLYEEVQAENSSNSNRSTEMQEQITQLKSENELLKNNNTEIASRISDTDIVIRTNAVVRNLMDETVKRLQERYPEAKIDAADLLQKMFLRYTVERFTSWFYPFVLKDKDIEEITGKSIKEIKQFFVSK
ncbi:MAG: hypothetical protein EOL95_07250 [Bacteroidia bacterium]|nr:hypothetical protein [Bacteroidia bacterium]